MVDDREDQHFPRVAFDNPIRKLMMSPERYLGPYVKEGQTVADLGCGPGFFTIAMAEMVGPGGKVYAVDSDEKAIGAVRRKVAKRGLEHVEAHACSAHELPFIADGELDFLFAYGLLCAMAPRHRGPALDEFNRVMKDGGRALISTARGWGSYVEDDEWEEILTHFQVHEQNQGKGDRWAVVTRGQG